MNSYDIFGIGAALVDTEIRVADEDLQHLNISKGLMTLVDEAGMTHVVTNLREHLDNSKRASGGSAANSLIAASYFGCNNFLTCRVADDDDGRFFLDDLANAGLDFNSKGQLVEGKTGKCLVMVTPDAERTMNTCLSVSETLDIESIQPDAISHSKYIYLEGYLATSESGLAAAIKCREIAEAGETGPKPKIAASLSDPALVEYFRDALNAMLGTNLEILFCNRDEALAWTQTDNLEDAVEGLKAISRTMAITCGAEGALIFDGDQQIAVAAPAITAIDTNGAGDMFAGAFLAALCRGDDYQRAGEVACHAASKVVEQFGPRLPPKSYLGLKNKFWS